MARAPKGKKARKAAPVKARVKKRSMARLQAIAPDTGPVTLEEARALARAKRPTLAFQDVGKTDRKRLAVRVSAEQSLISKKDFEGDSRAAEPQPGLMQVQTQHKYGCSICISLSHLVAPIGLG
jgi:hypothetical protein